MKKKIYIIYFIGLLLVPLVLFLLPADFFDYGESICISNLFFNTQCYACGLTRAVQHLIHLDVLVAYEFNKLIVIVFPLLIFVYYQELKRVYGKLQS